MSDCPCGSSQPLAECCEPLIRGERQAERAEELMRARYTAHVMADIDFIVRTHHPASRAEIDAVATERWARESDWIDFRIVNTDGGGADDPKGHVEFIAHYRDPEGRRQTHHELSLFEKHNGQWFFKSAELPEVRQFRRDQPKVGRNDPCPCGSGKKLKKCCGAALNAT